MKLCKSKNKEIRKLQQKIYKHIMKVINKLI